MIHAIQSARRDVWLKACAGGLWLVSCCIGSYLAMRIDFQPGRLGATPVVWPPESAMTRSTTASTVVAFLHPRCPCTRATVAQLIATLGAHPGAAVLVPMFVPPDPADASGWLDGEYARAILAAVPGATIIPDRAGAEARRFGALASGTILVYDPAGREIFRGGITDRRGGNAENPGVRRLAKILRVGAERSHEDPSPVFGCPLVATQAREQRGADAPPVRATR